MRQPAPSWEAVRRTLVEARDLCVLAYEVAEIPLDRIATGFSERAPETTVRRVRRDPESVLPLLVVAAPPGRPEAWVLWSGYVEYAALVEAGYTHAWAVVVHECYRVALHAAPRLEPEPEPFPGAEVELPEGMEGIEDREGMEGMEWIE